MGGMVGWTAVCLPGKPPPANMRGMTPSMPGMKPLSSMPGMHPVCMQDTIPVGVPAGMQPCLKPGPALGLQVGATPAMGMMPGNTGPHSIAQCRQGAIEFVGNFLSSAATHVGNFVAEAVPVVIDTAIAAAPYILAGLAVAGVV